MRQNLLMEIINITNMMNKKLIIESRVPILSGFDYGKMIDDNFSKGDIQVKNSGLKFADIAIETLEDLKGLVGEVTSKAIDELTENEAKFLKEINTRFLSIVDVKEIGQSLKPRFKEIAGNDAARAQLKIDLDRVMSPEQVKSFGEGISPNKYSRASDNELRAAKPELINRLKTQAPTKDEIVKIEEMYDRGFITNNELVQSIKGNPTFKEGFSLYDDYLNSLSNKSLDNRVTFTEYLIERGMKNPSWSANAGKATRFFASPFYNMVNGFAPVFNVRKVFLGIGGIAGYTFFGYTFDKIMRIIFSASQSAGEALEDFAEFLEGKSVTDENLQERWKSYFQYDEPQILSKDGKIRTNLFEKGKNASLKNNPPTFTRLTASETVGNVNPAIEIDGQNVTTVNFLISKTPVVGGNQKLSPDYIQLPSATPKPEEAKKTTVLTAQEKTDVSNSFMNWAKNIKKYKEDTIKNLTVDPISKLEVQVTQKKDDGSTKKMIYKRTTETDENWSFDKSL